MKLRKATAVAAIVLSTAACGSTAKQTAEVMHHSKPNWDAFWNKHSKQATLICDDYWTLVDEGWTDDNIYKQLKDAGNWVTHPAFLALVRRCFNTA